MQTYSHSDRGIKQGPQRDPRPGTPAPRCQLPRSRETMNCPLIFDQKGFCAVRACGKELPKRRRRWCSTDCAEFIGRNHHWGAARWAAIKRDGGRCVQCGALGRGDLFNAAGLEVNHILARNGRGYSTGCHNHLDGLETLCHGCHAVITAEQARERAQGRRYEKAALEAQGQGVLIL